MLNKIESDHDLGIWISQGALRARVLPFGATLQDLRLDHCANPLVLALPERGYSGQHRDLYAGAVVGRVAGRIAQGRVSQAAGSLVLDVNSPPHHLHGGASGFSHRTWQVTSAAPEAVTFTLSSPAGEGGYEGAVEVTARYEVLKGAVLALTLKARSDAATVLNLCHHPYFNLSGAKTIADHRLCSPAHQYLPADDTALPTGAIASVEGTRFDFRAGRALAEEQYDHSLCLHDTQTGTLAFAARLDVGDRGPAMEVWTTQPALHVYDGASIAAGLALDGRTFGARAGLALEAQGWPGAPNHAHFPSVLLQAGEQYYQRTEYRFD